MAAAPNVRMAGLLLTVLATLVEAGCSQTVKEKSAPCKRPAGVMGFTAGPGDCGPMAPVNEHPADVRAALAAIGG